jgi:DNA-binding CsgD family transcriptional regulator
VQESTIEMYMTRIYKKFRTNNKYVLMKKFWLKM